MATAAAIFPFAAAARMRTSSGAPPSPVPPSSPGEEAGVLAVHGGSEGDAAAAAVLTPMSWTPVTSRYACSWATAFAMANDAVKTPLPVAIERLTYDGSPPIPATLLFPAEGSGDRFHGGGCGEDAAANDMRSHRLCGHWLQPPAKLSASPIAVATASGRKINTERSAGTAVYTTTPRSPFTSAVKQAVQSIGLRRNCVATPVEVLLCRRCPHHLALRPTSQMTSARALWTRHIQ
ncbi:hypothetical protein V5799_016588 [Amblyomma americanum]|uniref:Uncharacterized protein n=1 Tax=Amblyomma americanum TaxID=6943 RepID=A0AAQ4F5R8_AMBAM